nr:hypothetical protein [Tanacetum cinerariifolium]
MRVTPNTREYDLQLISKVSSGKEYDLQLVYGSMVRMGDSLHRFHLYPHHGRSSLPLLRFIKALFVEVSSGKEYDLQLVYGSMVGMGEDSMEADASKEARRKSLQVPRKLRSSIISNRLAIDDSKSVGRSAHGPNRLLFSILSAAA